MRIENERSAAFTLRVATALSLRPVVDSFDRSLQPVGGVNPVVELPAIWDTALTNGVRVLGVQNEETPTVTVRAIFDAGQRDEPAGDRASEDRDRRLQARPAARLVGV
ncbi:MAG: hypothetical protein ACPH0C_02215, partial [Flavobacteriales bacterium]